jgi:cytochrome P450
LTAEEVDSLYDKIADLPYLHNVVRESLRFIPPVHSSLRVAMQDDVIPTSSPIKMKKSGGDVSEGPKSVQIRKGSFVHVPIEAFNLDREVWGEDAWEFK